MTTVNCPTCEKTVEWKAENSFRPFCSHRCKLIDLGEWASGNRSIPCNDMLTEAEFDESGIADPYTIQDPETLS